MSAKLTLSCPTPTVRERIWAAIRALGSFTSLEVALRADVTRKLAHTHLRALEKAGFIRVVGEKKPRSNYVYELSNDVGVNAPRVSVSGKILPQSGRNRMWKALRILGTFTLRELIEAASLPEAPIAPGEAEFYCLWLARGGYLRGGNKCWSFVPAMNTGPKAPQILKVKKLYDPNQDTIVCEGADTGRDDL